MERKCVICFQVKDEKEFRTYKHKVNNLVYNNFDSYCIECRRLYDKERHRIQRARKKEEFL